MVLAFTNAELSSARLLFSFKSVYLLSKSLYIFLDTHEVDSAITNNRWKLLIILSRCLWFSLLFLESIYSNSTKMDNDPNALHLTESRLLSLC
jgi:hypothetical protein